MEQIYISTLALNQNSRYQWGTRWGNGSIRNIQSTGNICTGPNTKNIHKETVWEKMKKKELYSEKLYSFSDKVFWSKLRTFMGTTLQTKLSSQINIIIHMVRVTFMTSLHKKVKKTTGERSPRKKVGPKPPHKKR